MNHDEIPSAAGSRGDAFEAPPGVVNCAGTENLSRLKSSLRRNPLAMNSLRELGVAPASIERLHLGLKQPYRSRSDDVEIRDALCFPLLGEGMRALGRYAYRNLPGVTENAPAVDGWGPGRAQVYRLGTFDPGAVAVVAADMLDCWLAWQCGRGEAHELAFVSRSHPLGWPAEWSDPQFWRRFERVVLISGCGSADFLEQLGPRMDRDLEVAHVPAPFSDLRGYCRSHTRPSLEEMLQSAEPWSVPLPRAASAIPLDSIGRFQATPVRISGAFADGLSYYPFTVEAREVEELRGGAGRVVQSYQTMILRSDGRLLTSRLLPAPRGTPTDRRVLALSDGTRLLDEPLASRPGTWSFEGIERYVAWRCGEGDRPYRDFNELLADLEEYLASRVWLPCTGQHLLCALYVALSFVFNVFDAIPLMLVSGPRGSGKSELGEAMARVSFNAVIATQVRAAAMIRLLDETRGLLVLDDMDGDGSSSLNGNGDLAQAIKTGYKASTARKPVADRGGRVRTVDFYGPKVITNTRGVGDVLGSRMVRVRTAPCPAGISVSDQGEWTEDRLSALRDELHAWAMAHGGDLHELFASRFGPFPDRSQEILAPLRAIAHMAGDRTVCERFEALIPDCLAIS